MLTKRIDCHIYTKVEDWILSITDEKVQKIARANTIVMGGCIASLLLNEKVNDYDIYFRTKEAAFEIAKYYLKNTEAFMVEDGENSFYIKAEGLHVDLQAEAAYATDLADSLEEEALLITSKEGEKKYRVAYISSNAITLTDKIQLITRFYGEPSTILESYDFVHCTNYWCSWEKIKLGLDATVHYGELVLNQEALAALLTKELKYIGSQFPICSVFRIRKFLKRGFTINAGQILKILLQIGQLDLTDPVVLQRQLIGVDCSYFRTVINAVDKKQDYSTAFLLEIIDEVFN
jgi:hypothetical protein